MAEKNDKAKVLRRDFGEFLEAPKKDPKEKTRYYIKVIQYLAFLS